MRRGGGWDRERGEILEGSWVGCGNGMGVSGKETGEKEGNRDGKKEQLGLGEGKIKGLERRAR